MNNIKYTYKFLVNMIPSTVRARMLYYLSIDDKYRHLNKGTKKIIITLAADYGNLGDVAITYAQQKFLREHFNDYQIILLPISRTYRDLRHLKKRISRDDLITIVGGGNMGSLYTSIERQRQFIIYKFPNNKIISFPQSIFYNQNKNGKKLLHDAIRTYSRHANLTLLARDMASYMFMKEKFSANRVALSPDIVLYLNEDSGKIRNEKQIILSLRQDKESALNNKNKQSVVKYLNRCGMDIIYRDTDLGDIKISIEDGVSYLENIWSTYSSAHMVITDRLHGMIFSVITGTPCIAINNNNGKVMGVYSMWLQGFSNITIVDSFDMKILAVILDELMLLPSKSITRPDLSNDFIKIKEIIRDNLTK